MTAEEAGRILAGLVDEGWLVPMRRSHPEIGMVLVAGDVFMVDGGLDDPHGDNRVAVLAAFRETIGRDVARMYPIGAEP